MSANSRFIKQTVFGYPHGNCYAACVASLLRLPLDEMPVIPAEDNFNDIWNAWFASRGLTRINFIASTDWKPKGLHIIDGLSPRELVTENGERVHHAVVGLNGELHFDPHPDNTFLDGEPLFYEIIYRLDPSQHGVIYEC